MKKRPEEELANAIVATIQARVASAAEVAVSRCVEAAKLESDAAKKEGEDSETIMRRARIAFMLAMPAMDTHAKVRHAVACVVAGVSMGLIDGDEASRRLYAAQVVLSSLRGGK